MFKLLSPIMHLSRLFCLLPLKWQKLNNNYILTKSRLYIAYSNIMSVFLTLVSIFGLVRLYEIDVVYSIRLATHTKLSVTFCDVTVVLSSCVLGVAITSCKIDKYIDYIDHLKQIDYFLRKHPPKYLKYLVVTVTTMSFTTAVLIVDLIMWLKISACDRNVGLFVVYQLPFYICYYFTIIMELVYWQFVHSIRIRLVCLNDSLAAIGHVQNVDIFFTKTKKNKNDHALDHVQALIRAYQELTEAANSVNNCYGLAILIVILGCLIHLLVTPFALYTIILNTGSSLFMVSSSMWMFGHVLRLFLIVEPCQGCLNESRTTAAMICKLLSSDLSKEIKKPLEIFIINISVTMSTDRFVVITDEMFRLLSPILHLGRLFCLLPLKWRKLDSNYVITKSTAHIAYSFATMILFILASIFTLTHLYQLDEVHRVRLGNGTRCYVTFSDVLVVLCPSVVGLVVTSVKIDSHVDYLDCLKKADRLLQKQPTRLFKYVFVTITTMLFASLVLILDSAQWLKISSKNRNVPALLIYFVPYYACYYFSVVMELVHWQLVHSIKIRIAALNANLIAIINQNGEQIVRIDRRKISNVVDTLTVGSFKQKQTKQGSATLDRIHDLMNAHQKLAEAAKSVNECYGLIILLLLLGCLIHLIVTPYGLYALISNAEGGMAHIIPQSMWMLGHILRLLLIVEPCHGCSSESANTAAIICKMLCSDLSGEIRNSLQIFVVYLSECRIEFTVLGLAKIHRGLLTTVRRVSEQKPTHLRGLLQMAGAVTTYLVILFQFNK
ncbi:7tm 7 domain containing protein [Asbolus verrucosus]|uniref:7tm 7 domain containing protein n=1 Tax=Asbolus verrucosus TaxID=1661398 RepID=A0A482VRV3_ASBVE|nr:7tm 7 domain containing protein [Asbolus verrucosus]